MNVVSASRSALVRKLPVQTHRIAGVTFEGRQEILRLLSELKPETSACLMFEKEPQNPYDPNAVAVKLVDDTKLGYIPRAETSAFVHSLCFGRIRSLGQAKDTSNLGCIVEVQPKLPPVINLAIPTDLVDQCSGLVNSLAGNAAWEAYRTDLCRQMNNKCSISNADTSNVEARWSIGGGVVKLVGFALQHPFLRSLQYIDPNDFVDFDETCRAISVLNPGMTEDEASMVFSRQVDLAEMRAGEGWGLDVEKLDTFLSGR